MKIAGRHLNMFFMLFFFFENDKSCFTTCAKQTFASLDIGLHSVVAGQSNILKWKVEANHLEDSVLRGSTSSSHRQGTTLTQSLAAGFVTEHCPLLPAF